MEGYSETEKIKILYEESLKDIRHVVQRIEQVSKDIAKVSTEQKQRTTRSDTHSAMQDVNGDVDVLSMGRAVIAITVFGIVMVALGAYVGGSRENWGIAGIVGGGAVFGMIAGTVIGYFANAKISESRKRKAFWNEPKRKAWREELKKKLKEE